jgi:hypothetical protein
MKNQAYREGKVGVKVKVVRMDMFMGLAGCLSMAKLLGNVFFAGN